MAKPGPTSRFEKLDYKDELRANLLDPRWTYKRIRKWLIKRHGNPVPVRTLEYWKKQIKQGVEGYVKEPYRPEDPRSDEYLYYIKLKKLVDNLEQEIKECDNFNKRMKLQKFYRDTLKDIYTLFKTYGDTTPEEAVADMRDDERIEADDDDEDIRRLVSERDSFQNVGRKGEGSEEDFGEVSGGDPREVLGEDDPHPEWDKHHVEGEGEVTEEELAEIEQEEREQGEVSELGPRGEGSGESDTEELEEKAGSGLEWYNRSILEEQLCRISDSLRSEAESLIKNDSSRAGELEDMLLGVVDEGDVKKKVIDFISGLNPGFEYSEEEESGKGGSEGAGSEGSSDKKRADTDKVPEKAGVNDETEQSRTKGDQWPSKDAKTDSIQEESGAIAEDAPEPPEEDDPEPPEDDAPEPIEEDAPEPPEDDGADSDVNSEESGSVDPDECICMKSRNQGGKILPNPDCPIHGELA